MKRLNFLLAAVLGLFAVACTEKENIPDSLTTEAADIVIPGIGGESPFTFSSNTDWMVTADKTWVEFDTESGAAGDITVTIKVGQNPTENARKSTVTIVAGSQETQFVVGQNGFKKTKETIDVFNKAHDYSYAVTSDVVSVKIADEASEWLSEKKTEDAGVVVFAFKENEGDDRSAKVTVTCKDSEHEITFNQIDVVAMTSAEVKYLGTSMLPYADDYLDYGEYFIELKGNGGGVSLAINADTSLGVKGIPAGEYKLDAAGKHDVGTFSVAKNEKYHTSVIENGVEVEFIDGTITVAVANDTYTITANLKSASNVDYKYSFTGKIGTITKDDFAGYCYSASFSGMYNTYFTAEKPNEWSASLIASAAPNEQSAYFQWIDMTFFTETGDVKADEFPVGTFSFDLPQEDTSLKYSAGILAAKANTFNGYAENPGKTEKYEFTGGNVTITKDETGKYAFAFENVTYNVIKEGEETPAGNGSYSATLGGIAVSEVSDSKISPLGDGSYEFKDKSLPYAGIYYGNETLSIGGKKYPGDHLFRFELRGMPHHVVGLYLNSTKEWKYEINFANRFCNTPLPEGTYTFVGAKSEELPDPNAGVKGHDVILNVSISYIENSYTGTKYLITGGSVTATATGFDFNLESNSVIYFGDKTATKLETPFKFTGKIEAKVNYWQDKSPKQ